MNGWQRTGSEYRPTGKDGKMMRLNRDELRALHPFGCDSYALTCQRLNLVAASATAQDAKKLYSGLSAQLFNECTEQDYRHLRRMVMQNMAQMEPGEPPDLQPPAGKGRIIVFFCCMNL